ncbi:MAG: 6-carboxytetrahydropterin synthase QueD [Prolixibacteraceae bacterium]|jgi:6-pyruvoyltetrahydropterin/6-carboxytetrahydropterin synthase|nr:6-carboxytetrahydropterin synthase QueD [Prolixibacteraceae bacterium]MDI9564220.1 6-carboxytetrahydropterin synthase QueD [Bacteroidota bacterium]NLS99489.1 6-carboxytetrahydropterin synthase QueD [Bacteroidales bacterium]OQB81453.1 MAG: 6-pyruvoyl tetrahydropterin synthase [Bacteroidetes bacterium ADurb.Bin123]HNZ68643.1 6-carboxytetrahydropterin synthase QueD [Prolixibacteraceae bacterium]
MAKIRITKRFHFEMAHALHAYQGLCSNIHGHSYNLEVTVMGDASHIPGHHGDGMVIDFHDLKTLVKTHITDRFDHALMINRLIPENRVNALKSTTDRLFIVDFQPTTENLVGYIAGILKPLMPQGVSLFSIRLFETVTSFAEWYATDNN